MARRKKGRPVHGWLIIDKPKGLTSTVVVTKLKRAFDARKAGHAGTLDPIATGILAVAFGEATKTIPYVVDAEKTYRFTASFGEARDTDDAEGKIVATSEKRPARDEILAALPSFIGEIEQTPPAYSAVKVAGERAYDLARSGEAVELAPRPVFVRSLELLAMPDAAHAEFAMTCGKGTYVRAFVRDLGQKLGCYAHVSDLRRTKLGPFSESQAIPLDLAMDFGNSPPAQNGLLPLKTALADIPALAVAEGDAARLRTGQAALLRGRLFHEAQEFAGAAKPRTVLVTDGVGDPIAIAELDRGEIVPLRVFNFGA